jgi:NIMA-interacting peptidyl-prolyl cis-trans isomerase 4
MPPKKKGKGQDDAKNAKSSKGASKKDDSSSSPKLKGAQSINVRHILVEKHAKKEEAVAALNSGRKFDDVAREMSEDKARQGGSLGWKTKGSLLPEFEKVAFDLEVSTTGNPVWKEVKTTEGWHLVMVEGRK